MSDRAPFDIAFDGIVSALTTFSAGEPVADRFTVVESDYRSQPPRNAGAYVYAYLGPITPERGRSASFVYDHQRVEYWLDCVAMAGNKADGEDRMKGTVAASARARYLIHQVLNALAFADEEYFGLNKNQIGSKRLQRIDNFTPEGQQGERILVAHRIVLDMELPWEPTRREGVAIDRIEVEDPERWKALFDYSKEE